MNKVQNEFTFLDLTVCLQGRELEVKYPNGFIAKELIDNDLDILFYLEFHLAQRKDKNLVSMIEMGTLQ